LLSSGKSWGKRNQADVETLVDNLLPLETANVVPGTGECICDVPPKRLLSHPDPEWAKKNQNLSLDHRCAIHGEKAQPAVWGRHKELQLSVPWNVWESLGVSRE